MRAHNIPVALLACFAGNLIFFLANNRINRKIHNVSKLILSTLTNL